MISLDEVKATVKRLIIVQNNVDNDDEKFICFNLIQNLNQLINQLEHISQLPDFKNYVEQWKNSELNKH